MIHKNKVYFFANWKMYLNVEDSVVLAKNFAEIKKDKSNDMTLAVFPSSLAMYGVKEALSGSSVGLGAQNGFWVDKGGYTGEVSLNMYKNFGCEYILVGHSERRNFFKESNGDVRRKMEEALSVDLIPVLCVGETALQKKQNLTETIVKEQLSSALINLNTSGKNKIFIAYEPVWAIGTGVDCSPEEASKIHKIIEEFCVATLPQTEFIFLYGGSVDEDNVIGHISDDHVNGILVGSASAQIEKVNNIIERVEEYLK